jgi:hypothetical protein
MRAPRRSREPAGCCLLSGDSSRRERGHHARDLKHTYDGSSPFRRDSSEPAERLRHWVTARSGYSPGPAHRRPQCAGQRAVTPPPMGTEWVNPSHPAPSWPVPPHPARCRLTSTDGRRRLPASHQQRPGRFPHNPPTTRAGGERRRNGQGDLCASKLSSRSTQSAKIFGRYGAPSGRGRDVTSATDRGVGRLRQAAYVAGIVHR